MFGAYGTQPKNALFDTPLSAATNPPTKAEVDALTNTINALIPALKTLGIIGTV
jgi:hypothetical protein